MSFRARLATLAESVDKSRRGEVWIQREDQKGYELLNDGAVFVLTPDQLEERRRLSGLQILTFDLASGA